MVVFAGFPVLMLAPLQSQALARVPHAVHGFFSRAGGVSSGLYASLNCGLGSNDDRALVLENRARVARHLGSSGERLLTCHQIHSATAVFVERPWAADAQPKADALVTRTPGLVLGALAADCAPILLADHRAGVIAAAHAGWKGALNGIAEATLDAMARAGARRASIVAVIGPCIGPAAYEVGPEFEDNFLAANPANARYFRRPTPAGRPHFDLPAYVAERLRAAGAGLVEQTDTCTYADEARFFSYRRTTHRGEGDYGRQISAIVLT